MTASATEGQVVPIRIDSIVGVVVEVVDLRATREFYEPIFSEAWGMWTQGDGKLTFRADGEEIAFVARRHPRAFADDAHHQAYNVRRDRVVRLSDQLAAAGHQVDWWHEDHPSERGLNPYVVDPSGNRVQLVGADDGSRLIDHIAIEVFEFDYCEYLYVTTLGGQVGYYYGWRTVDQEDAKRGAEGDDPAAPWTRKDNAHYRDFLVTDPETGELRPARFAGELGVDSPNRRLRVPRPNGQVYLDYGATRLVLISATKVRQEPPEDQMKGTPRVVFGTGEPAAEVERRLASTVNPYRREGRRVYFRDADGNFAELWCG